MALKYQQLITNQNLSIKCPPENCELNTIIEAARWVVEPIENELNFLPNHIYNEQKGFPSRTMDEKIKCGYCSISLHSSLEASKNAFKGLSSAVKSKLGYTHVAIGTLEKGIGLVTPIHEVTMHFELFEYDGLDWIKKFQIISEL